MKPLPILALAILTSALAATAVAWSALGAEEDDSLTAGVDLEAQLTRSRERIAELEDELARVRASQARLEKLVHAQNETLGFVSSLQEELIDIRMEMGRLRDDVDGGPSLAALARGKAADPGFQELFEESLAKVVDERVKKPTPADSVRAFQPFIRAGFQKEMRRIGKKLHLNEEQKSRFEKTMQGAFDKTMPLVTVMMDTSRSKEERTQAYDDVMNTYDDVNDEAASFLDPEQKETFDKQQERSRSDMENLRDMIESGAPLIPGIPAPPSSSPAPPDGDEG